MRSRGSKRVRPLLEQLLRWSVRGVWRASTLSGFSATSSRGLGLCLLPPKRKKRKRKKEEEEEDSPSRTRRTDLKTKQKQHEPVKNQANGPEDKAEAARAKPVAQSGENSVPRCPWCGNLDAEAAELGGMESSAVEAVGTPESAEEGSTLKERMRRSKRGHSSRRTFSGELDLGCDGKDLSGFEENRFIGNYSRGFGAASEIRAMKKKMLPPLSDGVAMREHLRSWAIAVACAVK